MQLYFYVCWFGPTGVSTSYYLWLMWYCIVVLAVVKTQAAADHSLREHITSILIVDDTMFPFTFCFCVSLLCTNWPLNIVFRHFIPKIHIFWCQFFVSVFDRFYCYNWLILSYDETRLTGSVWSLTQVPYLLSSRKLGRLYATPISDSVVYTYSQSKNVSSPVVLFVHGSPIQVRWYKCNKQNHQFLVI